MAETLEYQSAPSPVAPKGAMFTIFLIVFTDLLGFSIILPLLPFYAEAFSVSALAVTALFSIYSLCQLIGAPILGAISDRYGRRPVLVFSQLGSVAGYLLLALATFRPWSGPAALTMIYLSRVIDGLSGGNISTAQAYISDITTDENRAKGMGILGAAFGIGFSVGPAVGGLLGILSPSWPAVAAAVCAFVAASMSYFKLPEPPVHKGHAGGQSWALGALRGRPVLTQLILISALCMGAFVMMESTFAIYLALPQTFRYGAWQVGLIFGLAGIIIAAVQGGLIGRLTRMTGEWPLAIGGPLLVAAGMACFIVIGFKPFLAVLLVGVIVNAAGRSFQQPTISALISKFSSRAEQGVVFGIFHSAMSFARIIGPIVAGIVYEWHPTLPYVTAGAIVIFAAIWTVLLRVSVHREDTAIPI